MMDPELSAESAGLTYVTDEAPGIRRVRKGKGFTYQDTHSHTIKDPKVIQRIKTLVIPPAWQDVWICTKLQGHLQVTGRDKRNRKQYRYHEKWNQQRSVNKFESLQRVAEKIPELRKQIEADLKLPNLPIEKVLAAVIKVMLITQSRIGNSIYAEENESYGLTTIHNEHAAVTGSKVHLSFRGKSGVEHELDFQDKALSKIIRRCQELPGEELFAYLNENGESIDITSTHVNDYLKKVTGEDFTAKDLRTWGGTCKAIELLIQLPMAEKLSESNWKKRHVQIVRETSEFLHNTVSVCRKYYIHPDILISDRKGLIQHYWKSCRECNRYSREEKLLLKILGF